ncbi:MAG: DUF2220 domain-containing protein [Pseudomonadales bacterium]|nr:DUF2220 domain-containing protein [Pseudomonadales bacterium]
MYQSLRTAFARVRAGHPVDWSLVLQGLLNVGVDRKLIDKAAEAKVYGAGVYKVTILNEEAFLEIEHLISPVDKSSRSAASLSGNSHAVSVNGAMLAVWAADEPESVNRIFKDELPMPQPGRRHALITENEECFLNKEATYRFVKEHCEVGHSYEDIEFIYGSGNSVSNKRIIPYLKSFDGDVMCLFDVDLGGLKIYANLLSAGLPVETTYYLVPMDLRDRLQRSKRKASAKELDALSQVYGKSELTDKVIGAIRHYKTTIEQESYRADG